MGKKSWFSAMKKAVSPSIAKIKKEKRSHKSKSNPKNSWHVNQMSLDACSSHTEDALGNPLHNCCSIKETDFKLPENEQIKHVDSITYVVTVAEVKHTSCFLGKAREEIGAIKIQTAYRGYMARKAFRSLRAMRRLNLWLQGQAVKRQTASTLMRIQTMGRVQSQVRARRIRVAEVNEALQRQLIQKQRQKVLEKQAFDLSPKSKEQVEASLRSKKEAAERREKALAYAYSRQQAWRNSQSQKSALVDPNHLDWRWSWSNRWNAIRPWEAAGRPSKPGQMLKSPTSRSHISKPRLNTGCLVRLPNYKRHLVTTSHFTSAPRITVR